MKKVLVISTSLRQGSNSEQLADQFLKGAQSAGHQVTKIDLKQKDIKFCIGCLACHKCGSCILHDDMEHINDLMKQADVIVYATPVYFYEMSGQMKTLLDRTNPLYGSDYRFREVYILATAAEAHPETFDTLMNGVQGWVDCFPNVTIQGIVRGGDVTDSNEIQRHQELLQQAYTMGVNL